MKKGKGWGEMIFHSIFFFGGGGSSVVKLCLLPGVHISTIVLVSYCTFQSSLSVLRS